MVSLFIGCEGSYNYGDQYFRSTTSDFYAQFPEAVEASNTQVLQGGRTDTSRTNKERDEQKQLRQRTSEQDNIPLYTLRTGTLYEYGYDNYSPYSPYYASFDPYGYTYAYPDYYRPIRGAGQSEDPYGGYEQPNVISIQCEQLDPPPPSEMIVIGSDVAIVTDVVSAVAERTAPYDPFDGVQIEVDGLSIGVSAALQSQAEAGGQQQERPAPPPPPPPPPPSMPAKPAAPAPAAKPGAPPPTKLPLPTAAKPAPPATKSVASSAASSTAEKPAASPAPLSKPGAQTSAKPAPGADSVTKKAPSHAPKTQ